MLKVQTHRIQWFVSAPSKLTLHAVEKLLGCCHLAEDEVGEGKLQEKVWRVQWLLLAPRLASCHGEERAWCQA